MKTGTFCKTARVVVLLALILLVLHHWQVKGRPNLAIRGLLERNLVVFVASDEVILVRNQLHLRPQPYFAKRLALVFEPREPLVRLLVSKKTLILPLFHLGTTFGNLQPCKNSVHGAAPSAVTKEMLVNFLYRTAIIPSPSTDMVNNTEQPRLNDCHGGWWKLCKL